MVVYSNTGVILSFDSNGEFQVDTVEQAQHVVSAAKFGTRRNGTRSAPPARWVPGLTDMPYDPSRTLHECLNDQAAVMIQIESLEGTAQGSQRANLHSNAYKKYTRN